MQNLEDTKQHELAIINFEEEVKDHPPTSECPDPECIICGYRDCSHNEPLHYHHDGCPACFAEEMKNE